MSSRRELAQPETMCVLHTLGQAPDITATALAARLGLPLAQVQCVLSRAVAGGYADAAPATAVDSATDRQDRLVYRLNPDAVRRDVLAHRSYLLGEAA